MNVPLPDKAGWVHLWRCSEGHPEVWESGALCWQLWTLLLMRANGSAESKTLRDGTVIPRGALVTSFPEIREACKFRRGKGWKYPALATVKYWISWLDDKSIVDLKANRRGLFITICNYEKWNPLTNGKLTDSYAESCPIGHGQLFPTKKEPEEEKKSTPSSPNGDSPASPKDTALTESINRIVAHFQAVINPKAKVTAKTRKTLRTRLNGGTWTEEELLRMIDCYAADPFWKGQHGNEPIAWVFASDERVERVLGLEDKPRRTPDGTGSAAPKPAGWAPIEKWDGQGNLL